MNSDSRIIRGSLSLIILALLLVSYFINPNNNKLNECGFKELTGYSCPSCGLTRSLYSTSHFHFGDAFAFHLLGPVIYLLLILLAIKFGHEAITGKGVNFSLSSFWLKISVIGFFGIWFLYWITRVIGEMN